MPPSLSQARNHYQRQARIAAAAVTAVRRLFRANRPLSEVVATVAAYQYASASTSAASIAGAAGSQTPLVAAERFTGVSSAGFSVAEPIVALIDRFEPAPLEPLPANWWADAEKFMGSLETLIASEVADAGRSAASVEMVTRPTWQNYVRVLTPPSCPRCAILAGRVYRDLDGFKRHPGCDCVHWPVQNWQEAHDAGLVSSPQEAFDKGLIRGLSQADSDAIRDGADIAQVVNAAQGVTTTNLFGRNVKATTSGTTRRAAWRRANPSLLVRLRPESIYDIADGDRAEVTRLLTLYGYITP